MIIPVGEKRGI